METFRTDKTLGIDRFAAGLFLFIVIVGLLTSCVDTDEPDTADEVEQAITRVTEGLRSEIGVSGRGTAAAFPLVKRMDLYNVPGVSIAVVEQGQIVWARGFGVTEAGTSDLVNSRTIFQAGSISKVMAATGMLRLVREGVLELDTPVNEYLKSWSLPENSFTINEKVTLRRIASHSGGLTVHGFPGYSVNDPFPTIPEILDGTGAANTDAVRVDSIPGTRWRYSGGGTVIEQLVMTDRTGEPFPDLIKRLVFDPIGMTQSTYEQPLPEKLQDGAASGHGMNGKSVPGRWHVYPEMAAAGLWTTPTDLLLWAMEVAAARDGRSEQVLSRELATEMLTAQQAISGLGPFVSNNRGAWYFGHGGVDEGFVSQLIYLPDTGQGAAVMTNGDTGFLSLSREILFSIAAEYSWPSFSEVTPMSVNAEDLPTYIGEYIVTGANPLTMSIIEDDGRLHAQAIDWTPAFAPMGMPPREEIVLTAPKTAIGLISGAEYSFDSEGRDSISQLGTFGLTFRKQ